MLSLFGSKIGYGVVLKPGISVKFPWRLRIGNHAWIGEDVWIDNLAEVNIGNHACVSQGAYLCTGSHNWAKPTFDLMVAPIVIADHAWVGAKAILAPGTELREGGVLTLSSVAKGTLKPWHIYEGNPARPVRQRSFQGN